jgi:hypothetical protein
MLMINKKHWDKHIDGKKIAKNMKGSITIETVIVVPFLFLCVLFIIYISIRLYRIAAIQVIADLTVQRGSVVWNNVNKDINTGKPMNTVSKFSKNYSNDEIQSSEVPLYWRLFDNQKEIKKDRLKEWTLARLDNNSVLYNSERTENIESAEKTVEIEIKDYIILKNLQIEISYSNYSPMKNTLNKTGIERYSFGKETITAKSAVFEPAEFIRNVDFFIEAGEKLQTYYPSFREIFAGFETVVSDKKW